MSIHWKSVPVGLHFYAAQVADDGEILHTHPIPFATELEANRAALRLNEHPNRSIPRGTT